MTAAKAWRQRKLRHAGDLETYISELPSSRVPSIAEYTEYTSGVLQRLPELLQHFGSLGHRKLAKRVRHP